MMKKIVLALCVIGVATAQENFKDCLEQDSISCVQMTIYRKARAIFESPKIDIFGGLSFVKQAGRDARSANIDDAAVVSARSVEDRENALENFVTEGAKSFFQERSLNLDMASAARSVSDAIPEEVKSSVRSLVSEARGKKKKILKSLLPILGLVKLKFAALAVIALFGIALIAKKALIISIIALILSKFLLIKKLLSKGKSEHGGSSGGLLDAFDSIGAHSQPAQSLAYAGHKQY